MRTVVARRTRSMSGPAWRPAYPWRGDWRRRRGRPWWTCPYDVPRRRERQRCGRGLHVDGPRAFWSAQRAPRTIHACPGVDHVRDVACDQRQSMVQRRRGSRPSITGKGRPTRLAWSARTPHRSATAPSTGSRHRSNHGRRVPSTQTERRARRLASGWAEIPVWSSPHPFRLSHTATSDIVCLEAPAGSDAAVDVDGAPTRGKRRHTVARFPPPLGPWHRPNAVRHSLQR